MVDAGGAVPVVATEEAGTKTEETRGIGTGSVAGSSMGVVSSDGSSVNGADPVPAAIDNLAADEVLD